MKKNPLAIITARGGSKRIPQKNIRLFSGQPIINYSITAALKSNCFEEVMVSTDDRLIADIALSYGAKVPFLRSTTTSNDMAMLADVIEEVLLEYQKLDIEFDCFCCLLPTAPFISPQRLIEGYNLLKETGSDSVVPVVRFGYPIQRALKIEENKLAMIWPENLSVRSQDLMPAFHDAAQFYWCSTKSFLKQKKLFADFSVPLELPESEAQDIDTEEDWKVAEMKYKILKGYT